MNLNGVALLCFRFTCLWQIGRLNLKFRRGLSSEYDSREEETRKPAGESHIQGCSSWGDILGNLGGHRPGQTRHQ